MRHTTDITIDFGTPATNRDHGKRFRITEMPAIPADKWATKALFLLASSGMELSPDLLSGGMESIAIIGLHAMMRVKFEAAEPLFDELMNCVEISEAAFTRRLTPDDIEEIQTFSTLRREALKLHLGFFTAGAGLN